MKHEQRQIRIWLASAGMMLATIIAFAAEQQGMLTDIRLVLHDVLSPGRLVVLAMASPASAQTEAIAMNPEESAAIRSSLSRSEHQRRTLIIENARLRSDLRRQTQTQKFTSLISPTHSLFDFETIPVNVISRDGMPDSIREMIIDAGKAAGARQSELVVDGSGLLLDAGSDTGIHDGDRVLDGVAVIGRIHRTGRWISLVEPVHSKDFRASVQLLRQTTAGPHFGAQGLLEGIGDGSCRLTGVAATEPVTVGDEVVASEINGINGPRLYYGQVSRAEFQTGGQWDIIVRPASFPEHVRQAAVVRMQIQPPTIDTSLATNAHSTNARVTNARVTSARATGTDGSDSTARRTP